MDQLLLQVWVSDILSNLCCRDFPELFCSLVHTSGKCWRFENPKESQFSLSQTKADYMAYRVEKVLEVDAQQPIFGSMHL